MNDIKKLKLCDTFVNEDEKIKRADEVINTVGKAMKDNPNMSFDQGKSHLPSMNAVEYKDTKNMIANGEPLTPHNMAAKW